MPKPLDWIDPGNSGGSVTIPVLAPVPELPKLIQCKYCHRTFSSEQILLNHILIAHPIKRPFLYISGRQALERMQLLSPIHADAISLQDCDEVILSVDGGPQQSLLPKHLPKEISKNSEGFLKVLLINQQAKAEYFLELWRIDNSHLERMDSAYLHLLNFDDVSMDAIRRFAEKCDDSNLCKRYAGALADYAIGVLTKDRSGGVTISFEKYKEKFESAVSVLQNFSRPIPSIITNAICLSLNNFSIQFTPCNYWLLDQAIIYFISTAHSIKGAFSHAKSQIAGPKIIYPLNRVDADILNWVDHLIHSQVIDEKWLDEISTRLESKLLTSYDEAKCQVLLADGWIRKKEPEMAIKYLQLIANDFVFGPWASGMLKQY